MLFVSVEEKIEKKKAKKRDARKERKLSGSKLN